MRSILNGKLSAGCSCGIGPNRIGPFGLLQTVADVLKLLIKEDTIPQQSGPGAVYPGAGDHLCAFLCRAGDDSVYGRISTLRI